MSRNEDRQIAYQCGIDDFHSGYDVQDNPYTLGSSYLATAWERGWYYASENDPNWVDDDIVDNDRYTRNQPKIPAKSCPPPIRHIPDARDGNGFYYGL